LSDAAAIGSLLVANRGEIAIRIARTALELGIRTVGIYADDDARALHLRRVDEARPLGAEGVAAYLDIDRIVALAHDAGCDAVHPGYGFLSESAAFARACAERDLTFVGPSPDVLELFGDKARARALADECDVSVLPGTFAATSLEQAAAFMDELGPGAAVLVKALAGGGGRGIRLVHDRSELPDAFERCRSIAARAFGVDDLYVERYLAGARHIEVQVVGDGTGDVTHLGERDCSIQRQHQKLVEVSPSPGIDADVRAAVTDAAVRIARQVRYAGVGTIEFLVVNDPRGVGPAYAFIEANPRLQVEHTVTEELYGVDLVQAQLQIAAGARLADLGLPVAAPSGHAIQLRVNTETMTSDGAATPAAGVLAEFDPPTGAGVRVDTLGYAGHDVNPNYDSLLAKVIVRSHTPSFIGAARKAEAALRDFAIVGVDTNVPFLRTVVASDWFVAGEWDTEVVEDRIAELVDVAAKQQPEQGGATVAAPMNGTIVSIDVAAGDAIAAGQQLAVIEAMKMEHVVTAHAGGVVLHIAAAVGDTVAAGAPLVLVEATAGAAAAETVEEQWDPDHIRDDLAAVVERHDIGLDAARGDDIARHHRIGHRSARENITDLCDPDSFVEYGPLVVAAQRQRRSMQDLIENTPGDGMVTGVGRVNGELFGPQRSQCVVMSYDYTVLAGTQGHRNHEKKDRMFELAAEMRLPVVLFAEGGGGRPGDTDSATVAGLDVMAFHLFGRLSGLVPLVGVVAGRCFAGNAALAGCCDVLIATQDTTIGMGGPAMIEGGGLGVFRPEEVGPMHVQVPNGVVDVAVADEAEAVRVAKQYLSYFQGEAPAGDCADQRRLRALIPENRLRAYDVRAIVETLADTGSVLELRRHFGIGMVTALARIDGKPIGIIANNPMHLAGAVDATGADKAARFMQLCDAFDLPVLFLCDTPGIMVGPEAEKSALVRHAARMFVVGANLTVPFGTIILRKAYGLGAQAMAGGSFRAPRFTVAWPTGEFGGMGLEGAVRLGFRRELEAIEDPAERQQAFDRMVAASYQRGKALNAAPYFEFDDVIDPADSRQWVTTALLSDPPPARRTTKKRPCVDTW